MFIGISCSVDKPQSKCGAPVSYATSAPPLRHLFPESWQLALVDCHILSITSLLRQQPLIYYDTLGIAMYFFQQTTYTAILVFGDLDL